MDTNISGLHFLHYLLNDGTWLVISTNGGPIITSVKHGDTVLYERRQNGS